MQGIASASCAALPEVVSLGWTRQLLTRRRWLVPVPHACAPEFDQIARVARGHFGPLADLDADQFELPACAEAMALMRAKLVDWPGFAVLDRVPVERYRRQEAQAIGWVLANLMGRVVAQKHDGTRLYDVRDTGKALAHGIRRSITNLEQEFHTDGSWLSLPPSFIGLYCLQPAADGGMSRCANLVTVHDALRGHPALLDRLHQPFWWDRQAEHAVDDLTCSRGPIFWHADGRVSARYYDELGADALEAVRELVETDDNCIEFLLGQGQFLYINNRQIAHSRTAFRDDDAKRHLMRFWNRDEGTADLEGGPAGAAAH